MHIQGLEETFSDTGLQCWSSLHCLGLILKFSKLKDLTSQVFHRAFIDTLFI